MLPYSDMLLSVMGTDRELFPLDAPPDPNMDVTTTEPESDAPFTLDLLPKHITMVGTHSFKRPTLIAIGSFLCPAFASLSSSRKQAFSQIGMLVLTCCHCLYLIAMCAASYSTLLPPSWGSPCTIKRCISSPMRGSRRISCVRRSCNTNTSIMGYTHPPAVPGESV